MVTQCCKPFAASRLRHQLGALLSSWPTGDMAAAVDTVAVRHMVETVKAATLIKKWRAFALQVNAIGLRAPSHAAVPGLRSLGDS